MRNLGQSHLGLSWLLGLVGLKNRPSRIWARISGLVRFSLVIRLGNRLRAMRGTILFGEVRVGSWVGRLGCIGPWDRPNKMDPIGNKMKGK